MGTVNDARAVLLYWTAGAMITTPRMCKKGHKVSSIPANPTIVTQKQSNEKKKSVNCSTSYFVKQYDSTWRKKEKMNGSFIFLTSYVCINLPYYL